MIQLSRNKIIRRSQAKQIRSDIKEIKTRKLFEKRFDSVCGLSILIYCNGTLELYYNNEIKTIRRVAK